MTSEVKQSKRPIPRKLDDAMIEALTETVSKGNYFHDAAAIAGIAEPTLYDWINQAQQDEQDGLTEEDSLYIRLSKSLKRARAKARADMVAVVRESAQVKREWIPALTFLERTDPEHWGRPAPMTLNINETKTVTITHVEYSLAGSTPGQVIEAESRELIEENPLAETVKRLKESS